MTDPDQEVVAEVEAFCERHQADPRDVHPAGLRFLFDDATTPAEIDAALDELAVRANGTEPRE